MPTTMLGPVKIIKEENYVISFDTKTGREVLQGINGHEDPFILKSPSLIDVGVMGHCVNSCEICYQGDKHQPNMPLEDFQKLAKTVSHSVNQIALGGRGDVNMHEDFGGILKACKDNHIVPNFTTSGNGLTPSQVYLTEKYCGAVAVSDYDQPHTYEAISMLTEAGCKTNIHFVLSRDRVERAINILKGEDVWNGQVDLSKLNAIVFLLFKTQGKAKDMLDLVPTEEQLKEFATLVTAADTRKNLKFGVGMDSCLVNHLVAFDALDEKTKMFVDTCEGSRMSCYVTPDCKLKPCSFGGEEEEVCIKTTPFQQIWESGDAFTEFRKVLNDNPACCPYCL